LFVRRGLGTRPTPSQVALAAQVFKTVDPKFMLFAKGSSQSCRFVRDEPVMVFSDFHSQRGLPWRFLRANGETCSARPEERLEDLVGIERPQKLAMPAIAEVDVNSPTDAWKDEEFLVDAASDAQIKKYRAAKEKAGACAATEWKKRDSRGTAGYYNIVTYDSQGSVAKIEPFYDRVLREVEAACNLPPLWRERDAIRARRTEAFAAEQKKLLAGVEAALTK
jgi:hypothetical protein